MLLAIETSTRQGSVAVVGARTEELPLEGQNHGASLAESVKQLVPDFDAIDAYAISVGPGSFTGLRIGVSFLKGIGFVHPRPTIAVPSLQVIATQLAERHPEATRFLAALDARKGDAFAALYRRAGADVVPDPDLPEGLYEIATLPRGIVTGGDPLVQLTDPEIVVPNATTVGRIAQRRHLAGAGVDPQTVEPVYHQLSGAEVTLGIRASFDSVVSSAD